MGKPVTEITRLYLELRPLAFRHRRWRLTGLVPRFDAAPLTHALQTEFGDRTMDTADLRTGFAVVARCFDTGSPWLISNDPRAPYWADPVDRSFIGICTTDWSTSCAPAPRHRVCYVRNGYEWYPAGRPRRSSTAVSRPTTTPRPCC
jgi:hypothetical protein